MKKRWKIGLALLIAALGLAAGARSQSMDVRMLAEVGYGGTVLNSRSYPLKVEVTSNEALSGVLSVDVPVQVGKHDTIELPVELKAGETAHFHIRVNPRVRQLSFPVKLIVDDRVMAFANAIVSRDADQDALIVGLLDAQWTTPRVTIEETYGERTYEIVTVPLGPDSFPQDALEMAAFDALAIGTRGLSALSGEQRTLVEEWQKDGGLLLEDESEAMLEALARRAESRTDGPRFSASASLTTVQRVGVGVGMQPVTLALAAYVAVAGAGLYALLKRLDRSKLLWLALPLASAAGVALVAAMSASLGLNRPTAASVVVAEYDEAGEAYTEEMASVSYADQGRVRLTVRDGKAISRYNVSYFGDSLNEDTDSALRDRVTLGDEPALELQEGAPWLTHTLVIDGAQAPEGSVTARAWVEEDGLHAEVENGTRAALEDAVLLTKLGYAELGDIAAGETASALLARPSERVLDANGDERILPNTMLADAQNISAVENAYLYPERASEEGFSEAKLPDAERYARSLMDNAMNLVYACASDVPDGSVACVLFAKSEALTPTELLANGEPIERTAHMGIILARAAFDRVSPSGHVYFTEGAIPARAAVTGEDGKPMIGERIVERTTRIEDERLFGFSIDEPVLGHIERLCVSIENARPGEIELSAYDHVPGIWTVLQTADLTELSANQIARFVNEEGELFLRYVAKDGAQGGYAYVPQIIVEGSEEK